METGFVAGQLHFSSMPPHGNPINGPSCTWSSFFIVTIFSRPPLLSSGEFMGTDSEVPGSIPGSTTFSE
jgi:hypothetical protein